MLCPFRWAKIMDAREGLTATGEERVDEMGPTVGVEGDEPRSGMIMTCFGVDMGSWRSSLAECIDSTEVSLRASACGSWSSIDIPPRSSKLLDGSATLRDDDELVGLLTD